MKKVSICKILLFSVLSFFGFNTIADNAPESTATTSIEQTDESTVKNNDAAQPVGVIEEIDVIEEVDQPKDAMKKEEEKPVAPEDMKQY